MFKSTSRNTVRRESLAPGLSGKNSHGIDESAFKKAEGLTEAEELGIKKKALESKCSKLKAQITLANRRHTFREPGAVDYKTYLSWQAERSNLAAQLTAIDKRLTEIKFDRRMSEDAANKAEQKEFGRVFMNVAKEMLAEPVYDRLIVAAIHRAGECQQDKSESTATSSGPKSKATLLAAG